MSTSPIYLTEADVGRLATVKDAIATLEALFATWGQPSTSNLPRQRATCGRRLQPDGRGLWSEGGARPQGLCRREGRAVSHAALLLARRQAQGDDRGRSVRADAHGRSERSCNQAAGQCRCAY